MTKKILTVDDDPLILMGLEIVLTDAGYIVESCSRGEEACQKAMAFKPDAIILDVMLADVDGRDIARELKKCQETRHIPIIMISANQFLGKDIYSCGIDLFIPKPFESEYIVNAVRKYTTHQNVPA
ncbi:MAG: response regulator [Nitrosopumilus sp.]|nr:response regulator [Nitrosopumilus sp.]MBA3550857.1 response regulator [Patescibacteria group bacterium]